MWPTSPWSHPPAPGAASSPHLPRRLPHGRPGEDRLARSCSRGQQAATNQPWARVSGESARTGHRSPVLGSDRHEHCCPWHRDPADELPRGKCCDSLAGAPGCVFALTAVTTLSTEAGLVRVLPLHSDKGRASDPGVETPGVVDPCSYTQGFAASLRRGNPGRPLAAPPGSFVPARHLPLVAPRSCSFCLSLVVRATSTSLSPRLPLGWEPCKGRPSTSRTQQAGDVHPAAQDGFACGPAQILSA